MTTTDLKILKTCSHVIFRHVRGQATIEGAWPDPDREYKIPVTSRFRQYGDDKIPEPETRAKCFAFIGNHDPSPLHTVLELLRPGDEIVLMWLRDNNLSMEKSGIHCDRLDLIVRRTSRELHFIITEELCEDNVARMIQRS